MHGIRVSLLKQRVAFSTSLFRASYFSWKWEAQPSVAAAIEIRDHAPIKFEPLKPKHWAIGPGQRLRLLPPDVHTSCCATVTFLGGENSEKLMCEIDNRQKAAFTFSPICQPFAELCSITRQESHLRARRRSTASPPPISHALCSVAHLIWQPPFQSHHSRQDLSPLARCCCATTRCCNCLI